MMRLRLEHFDYPLHPIPNPIPSCASEVVIDGCPQVGSGGSHSLSFHEGGTCQWCLRKAPEHKPGCPTIADDESDEVLADYGRCTCVPEPSN